MKYLECIMKCITIETFPMLKFFINNWPERFGTIYSKTKVCFNFIIRKYLNYKGKIPKFVKMPTRLSARPPQLDGLVFFKWWKPSSTAKNNCGNQSNKIHRKMKSNQTCSSKNRTCLHTWMCFGQLTKW